jgi:hypothetical protein
LTVAEIRKPAQPAALKHMREIGAKGGKAASPKVDTKAQAIQASATAHPLC